ncbi:MAG: ribonuclease III, partial [Lachnospiraceae bacterium]|nr:ribonuclease III [Lachnospiraceae bacterium]
MIEGYKELQKLIGYDFRDSDLLIKALSHSSYVNELKLNKHDDYERTEFLGDAVLELTVSEFLYTEKPS